MHVNEIATKYRKWKTFKYAKTSTLGVWAGKLLMKVSAAPREYAVAGTHFWRQIIHISEIWGKCSFCQMQISLPDRFRVIIHWCRFKTHCMCLHANHAHHTVPSPVTGTTRRPDACTAIVGKLWTVKADNENEAISLQVSPDRKHVRWGFEKHANTIREHLMAPCIMHHQTEKGLQGVINYP